ncbi:MAG TPA: glycosyltransferase family 39 protein [Xanthobacteraceae bacterium]|jgi:4-amino-4-deoxy-L-arabinose transferase-like glycosyltransferase|nr:glycosyltransferase family 39 protein [Xanthobacteraceae bacterium]
MLAAVTHWIERRPETAFVGFLALHGIVWAALPSLLYPNLPLDLIEALTYGREWQLGYDKLPPLPWWTVEVAYRLFHADIAYYALGQIAVIAAFVAIWALARRLVGALGALVAVLIVDGLHYFSYTAAKFNHDVIELPFWAMSGYAFWSALRTGRIVYWIILGLSVGFAFWAKYFVVVLAIPLALFLLLDPTARASVKTPGPWVALAVALGVMAPHLVWLVQNDFLPFAYANARAAPVRSMFDHLLHPLEFAGSQGLFLVPALVIAAPLFVRRWGEGNFPAKADAFDLRIVTLLAFGPMATITAVSIVTGRGLIAMWGYPLWLFLGLWIVLFAPRALNRLRLERIVTAWAVVFALYALAFIANYEVMPRFDHRYRAVFFPGERLGMELSHRFKEATGTPLAYVIGTMWVGGNIGHYAAERPRVLIDGDPHRAPWIDLNDLKAKGAIVVWSEGEPQVIPLGFANAASGAQIQPPLKLRYRRGEGEMTIGWAIIPPAK